MPSSNDLSSITHFAKASHRVSYHSELSLAYYVTKVAIQMSPGLLYRNLTNFEDDNLSIDLATIAKIHLFKKVS